MPVAKRYKKDYLRFLTYAHASNDETFNHLRKIAKLYPQNLEESKKLAEEYDQLGKKLHFFIKYVEKNWRT